MFRNLSLALAVFVALWPAGGSALSLGSMTTKSALSEPFQADIELIAADADDLQNLQVTLASPADFARAGVDRPFLLTKLRFKVMRLEDGRSVIRVTTKTSVREPFLDFLVEINWPKGRLLREFTALLDPLGSPPARVVPPLVSTQLADTPPSTSAATVSSPQSQRIPAQPPPLMTITGHYGPVRPGATLWGVSRELQTENIGLEQVAMALFRGNPEAFAHGNINMLKAGSVLGVPSPEDMLAQPLAAARADFLDEARGIHRVQSVPADRLHIAVDSPQAHVPLASQEGGAVAGGNEVAQVRTDLMMVRETSESNRQETENLRTRIRELESQLDDVRQLLRLRSDQLAQIQAGQLQAPGNELSAPLGVGRSEEPAALTESPPESVVGSSLPVAHVQPDLTQPLVVASQAPAPIPETQPVVAVQGPNLTPETQHAAEQKQQIDQTPPALPATKVAPAQRAMPPADWFDPAFLDQILKEATSTPVLAGSIFVLLLSLVGLLLRRRRSLEMQLQNESALLVSDTGMPREREQVAPTVAKVVETQEDTSFLSDFSPSDIDALQQETGEVDPAAEADVYIAYGRYQQAETLIQQALDQQALDNSPERPDLKLKLLEIYFTTRNVAAFTRLAEEMGTAGIPEQEPQVWERVRSMGQELLPDHALFGTSERPAVPAQGTGEEGAGESADESMVSDMDELGNLDLNLDLNLDTELPEMPSELGDGSVFDLRPKTTPSASPSLSGTQTVPTLPTLDQESEELTLSLADLTSFGGEDSALSSEATTGLKMKQAHRDDEEPSLVNKQSGLLPIEEEEEILPISLDDLDSLDLGSDISKPIDSEISSTDRFETSYPGEAVETKLDLARAYLEMGDREGTREILQEVLQEGNQQQQALARELLAQVS